MEPNAFRMLKRSGHVLPGTTCQHSPKIVLYCSFILPVAIGVQYRESASIDVT